MGGCSGTNWTISKVFVGHDTRARRRILNRAGRWIGTLTFDPLPYRERGRRASRVMQSFPYRERGRAARRLCRGLRTGRGQEGTGILRCALNDTKSEWPGFVMWPSTLTYRRLRTPAASPVKAPPHPRQRRDLSHSKMGEANKRLRGTQHPNSGEVRFAALNSFTDALNDTRRGPEQNLKSRAKNARWIRTLTFDPLP